MPIEKMHKRKQVRHSKSVKSRMVRLNENTLPMDRDDIKQHIENSRFHARKRAYERYNISLSVDDIKRVEVNIRSEFDALKMSTTDDREIWIMRLQGVLAVAVYNTQKKCLSTFLPQWYAKKFFNGEDLPNYNPRYYESCYHTQNEY